jgi:hypothetical protein
VCPHSVGPLTCACYARRPSIVNSKVKFILAPPTGTVLTKGMAKDPVREYLSKVGRKGAKAANLKRSAEQRREVARKAAQARWNRDKAKQSTPKS